ncbi:MAG: chemotaxis protein CheA, partial [Deltaproteobacteria bacterium]
DEAVRAALEEADRLAEAMPPSLKSVAQTVRVDISRLDHLMNLVGELVLAKANLQRLAERLREHPQVAELAGELGREVRSLDRRLAELQEGVLDARMVPLKQTFDKLGRMVRKIGRETGKEIHLEVHGSDTELDKLIMEELSDPLMHLLRNAIDHGIEPAEERAAKGKPTAGRITIRAAQKGSHVTIEVADDGRGLDVEAITQRALERGLVSEAQLNEMSERDRLNLIFVPGFSTKDSVTELSGRGVGLDVVKNNISELSGLVEVATRPGAGTRFILTLPTTLAILQALVVQIAGRVFAVPLASVSEILSFDPTAVHRVEGHEVIDLRGRTLPLLHLDRLFGFDGAHAQPTYVVVAGLAESRIGLLVDTLQGEQDVVIKGLGKKLGHVRGIAGATDLGDRRTTLVLDVGALIEECLEGASLEAVGT